MPALLHLPQGPRSFSLPCQHCHTSPCPAVTFLGRGHRPAQSRYSLNTQLSLAATWTSPVTGAHGGPQQPIHFKRALIPRKALILPELKPSFAGALGASNRQQNSRGSSLEMRVTGLLGQMTLCLFLSGFRTWPLLRAEPGAGAQTSQPELPAPAAVAPSAERGPVPPRSPVWFPVRAHAQGAGSVPAEVHMGGNRWMFLSHRRLSLCCLLSNINTNIKTKKNPKTNR